MSIRFFVPEACRLIGLNGRLVTEPLALAKNPFCLLLIAEAGEDALEEAFDYSEKFLAKNLARKFVSRISASKNNVPEHKDVPKNHMVKVPVSVIRKQQPEVPDFAVMLERFFQRYQAGGERELQSIVESQIALLRGNRLRLLEVTSSIKEHNIRQEIMVASLPAIYAAAARKVGIEIFVTNDFGFLGVANHIGDMKLEAVSIPELHRIAIRDDSSLFALFEEIVHVIDNDIGFSQSADWQNATAELAESWAVLSKKPSIRKMIEKALHPSEGKPKPEFVNYDKSQQAKELLADLARCSMVASIEEIRDSFGSAGRLFASFQSSINSIV